MSNNYYRRYNRISLNVQKIGIEIRDARKRSYLSVSDSARIAQLSPQTLRKIEQGQVNFPNFQTMAHISTSLNLDLNSLVIWDRDSHAPELVSSEQPEEPPYLGNTPISHDEASELRRHLARLRRSYWARSH